MLNKKNTLFISYDGMTDPLGQSQVIPYLQGIQKDGYNIFLLSCEKKEAYQKGRATVLQLLENSGIHWVPLLYTKRPPVLSTMYDVLKLKRAATRIHRRHPISLVHTRPGIPSLVGAWFKKKYRVAFLNDIREFYADSRVDGGMWDLNKMVYKRVYKYFKQKEAEQVKLSDGIVCLTAAGEKIIRSWPEYDQSTPLAMIPCSVDLTLFDAGTIENGQKAKLAAELGISGQDIVVSYLGSIGGWYLTEEMLRFCKVVSSKYPAAKFLFISPHQHSLIQQLAASHGIEQDRVITVKATRNEVPILLSLSTFSVFFIKPCYSKLSSSPTKHGEIMGMGIPVVTNAGVGDVEDITNKYNSGVILHHFSAADYEAACGKIIETSFDKAQIRRGALEFYSLDAAIAKYREMYAAILSKT